MTVPPVSNRRQTNSDCSIRQTRSLFLPTQAYNRMHFYMVRLVWFPGYMDWERIKYTWEIRGQKRTFAERGHLHNLYPGLVTLVLSTILIRSTTWIRWRPGICGPHARVLVHQPPRSQDCVRAWEQGYAPT